MCMSFPDYDTSPVCRRCNTLLSEAEKLAHIQAKMPAVCAEHLLYYKEQLKKCVPLMQKMNLS